MRPQAVFSVAETSDRKVLVLTSYTYPVRLMFFSDESMTLASDVPEQHKIVSMTPRPKDAEAAEKVRKLYEELAAHLNSRDERFAYTAYVRSADMENVFVQIMFGSSRIVSGLWVPKGYSKHIFSIADDLNFIV